MKDKTKDRVLASAIKIVTEKGIHCSLREISNDSGISYAHVHRTWTTKEDLLSHAKYHLHSLLSKELGPPTESETIGMLMFKLWFALKAVPNSRLFLVRSLHVDFPTSEHLVKRVAESLNPESNDEGMKESSADFVFNVLPHIENPIVDRLRSVCAKQMSQLPVDKRLDPDLLGAVLYTCSICLDVEFIGQIKNLFQVGYSAEELSIMALNSIERKIPKYRPPLTPRKSSSSEAKKD